jgi:hypothetical protein
MLKVLILAVVATIGKSALTRNMDPEQALKVLFAAKGSCYDMITDNRYGILTTVDCGNRQCNFPVEACFMIKANAFTSNDRTCRSIPSSCRQEADNIDNGSGGGSSNTRPPVTNPSRTFPPRTFPPRTQATTTRRFGGRFTTPDRVQPSPAPSSNNDCTSRFSMGARSASGCQPAQPFTPVYYYNKDSGRCTRSFYRGCGGNGNRYATLQMCEDACENNSNAPEPTQPPTTVASTTNRCTMSLPVCPRGGGRRFLPFYYYRPATGRCTRTFTTCQVNKQENLFLSQRACRDMCVN